MTSIVDQRSIIGIDVGGTFTDAFLLTPDGRAHSAKVPSTPPDFARGVLGVLEELAAESGCGVDELLSGAGHICHGTTAPLNAIVTGDVAKVGFLTTKGHRDSLFIMNLEGRHLGLSPAEIQDIVHTHKPAPLILKALVREVTERVDAGGEVVVPLDEDEARRAIGELAAAGVEAIAVSLLWSFLAPAHERRIRDLVREVAPGLGITLSHEISPRIREFARSSTTVLSAQVGPTLERYLGPLDKDLRDLGLGGPLLVMQGSGGAVRADEAPRRAIDAVGSVLTGGVRGAATLARQLGHDNVIATDIGGTTFLVGLVVAGEPVLTSSWTLNRHPVNTVMARVEAIGSGGGAISWVDDGGNLRVGPRSAGAVPGPACYANGGTSPTNTDANLVLGILDPERFLGGRKRLRPDRAAEALEREVARPLGMTVPDAAASIFAIQNSQTADLVSKMVLETGHDPRDFTLYAFGGAGPIHCHAYGRDLGVREILVPLGATASAFSAFGLAATDVMVVRELSDPCDHPVDTDRVNRNLESLEAAARAELDRQGVAFATVAVRREIDVRYRLQIAEVPTPVPLGELDDGDVARSVDDFEAIYAERFGAGTGFAGAGFQLLTYRVFAIGVLPGKPGLLPVERAAGPNPSLALRERRPVLLDRDLGFADTPVYDYAKLRAGHVVDGPAIVDAATTTVVIGNGQQGVVDDFGNLAIRPVHAEVGA